MNFVLRLLWIFSILYVFVWRFICKWGYNVIPCWKKINCSNSYFKILPYKKYLWISTPECMVSLSLDRLCGWWVLIRLVFCYHSDAILECLPQGCKHWQGFIGEWQLPVFLFYATNVVQKMAPASLRELPEHMQCWTAFGISFFLLMDCLPWLTGFISLIAFEYIC